MPKSLLSYLLSVTNTPWLALDNSSDLLDTLQLYLKMGGNINIMIHIPDRTGFS